jgi:hypothetical protein
MQLACKKWLVTGLAAVSGLVALGLTGPLAAQGSGKDQINFNLVRSQAATAAKCLPKATANVTIENRNLQQAVETLTLKAHGLPPNTDFDFFVIQVPNKPFGLSWYQGDFETNSSGAGQQSYVGRFSVETFIVAPGTAPAPDVFNQPPFPDATSNPTTAPVQTYHLGLWFNSPKDAAKAGCGATVTPFNGEHNAGIQALSSRNFPDNNGPLRSFGQ